MSHSYLGHTIRGTRPLASRGSGPGGKHPLFTPPPAAVLAQYGPGSGLAETFSKLTAVIGHSAFPAPATVMAADKLGPDGPHWRIADVTGITDAHHA